MALAIGILFASYALHPPPLAAQFPPEIRGTVTSADRDTPVVGARVRILGSTLEAATGSDGAFRLRGAIPGERVLLVSALGFRGDSRTISVENGRVTSLRIRLRPRPIELDELRARGRADRSEAAGRTVVFDREAILRSGETDLGGVLSTVGGVTVTRRGGPGSPVTASIRGSAADQILVLVDGVPIHSLLTGEADLSTVTLDAVDRIEVTVGGASTRYGPRAMAGVIRVETIVPNRAVWGGWFEKGGLGAFGGSGFGSGPLLTSESVVLSGRIHGEVRTVDGSFDFPLPDVRGGGRAERENAESVTKRVGASLAARIGSDPIGSTRVRGAAEWVDLDRGMPGPVVQPTLGAEQEQDRTTGLLGVDWEDDTTTLSVQLDLQRQRARFRDDVPPTGAAFDQRSDANARGARVEVARRGTRTRLVTGAEWRSYRLSGDALGGEAPDRVSTGGVWLGGSWRNDLGTNLGVELSTGLRLNGHSQLDDARLSPEFTASFHANRWVFRASVRSGFAPPSLADQFFQEGVFVRPNPDLEPERTEGEIEVRLEVGTIRMGGVEVEAHAAAYRSDIEGMILWFPDFRFIWSPDNFDVRRRGVDLGAALRVASRVEVDGQWSWTDLTYDMPALSGPVAYRPTRTGRLSVETPLGSLRTRWTWDRVGSRRTVPGSALNRLPAYDLIDLRVSHPVRLRKWSGELLLRIDNVMNTHRSMLADYPSPGRLWSIRLRIENPSG